MGTLNSNITYRNLQEQDIKEIDSLLTELHNFHADLEPDRFEKIDEYGLNKPCEISIGAFNNQGSLIGIAMGVFDTDFRSSKVAVLSYLYVAEEYRDVGIGIQLIEEFEKKSKELKASVLKLGVSKKNTNAISLYERLGFKTTTYHMEKPIW